MTKEINHNFVVFIIRLTLLLYIVASTGLIPTFGDELFISSFLWQYRRPYLT